MQGSRLSMKRILPPPRFTTCDHFYRSKFLEQRKKTSCWKTHENQSVRSGRYLGSVLAVCAQLILYFNLKKVLNSDVTTKFISNRCLYGSVSYPDPSLLIEPLEWNGRLLNMTTFKQGEQCVTCCLQCDEWVVCVQPVCVV